MYVESYQWQIGLERILILPLAPCGFDTPFLPLPYLESATMILALGDYQGTEEVLHRSMSKTKDIANTVTW